MAVTYEQLVELLGGAESDPHFSSFVSDVGEVADIMRMEYAAFYDFPAAGLSVIFGDGVLQSILFHFTTASNKCGEFKRYEGPLPAAISADDRRSDVWKKLGMKAARTELVPGADRRQQYHWDHFYIGSVELTFDFHSVTNVMTSLSIQLASPSRTPQDREA